MIKKISKNESRLKRQYRIRNRVKGTSDRPRLCVFRSLNNVYAQIIDDDKQITLCSASTLDKEVKTKASNIEAATEVGTLIAKKAIDAKLTKVVFDRNGYLYHGKVKALAEAARQAGLEF